MSEQTIPIGLVQAAVAFAIHHQWDVDKLLSPAHVSPMLLADERARVTESQVVQLAQMLWDRTDDEMFGLGPTPLPRGTFRLLCYGLLSADDLHGALQRFGRISGALPGLPDVVVNVDPELTSVRIAQLDLADPGGLLATTAAAMLHRLMSWALGQPIELSRVWVSDDVLSDELFYEIFGAPVEVDPSPGVEFPSRYLTAPLVRSERELDELIRTSPRAFLRRPVAPQALTDQVRALLEAGLAQSNPPTGDVVARRLAMSPQTMRRRLADEGSSLKQLREELIRDEAISALVRGDESVAELAERLGFSEASAFTRAFRRWTGATPGAYRRNPDA